MSSEPKDGETSHLCTLKLKCKPIYKVAIKGIDIVSEAKTLEIYDDIDGYLQSVKGVPIQGCEDGHVFYISSFQIREPARNMEIKVQYIKILNCDCINRLLYFHYMLMSCIHFYSLHVFFTPKVVI